jgi:adenylate kinase
MTTTSSVSERRIALFGPQGSGKGTQAEKIQLTYGLPHIAPGNMFRQAIAERTDIGRQVEEIINAGNLVPDELTNRLMRERITAADCIDGFVFDGYPRNTVQADALDSMTNLTHVLVIDVPEEESIRRISQRRSCSQCGATYHLEYKPTLNPNVCDRCGSPLTQRADDTPDAIRQRLAIYSQQTAPLFERYQTRGIFHTINGVHSIEEVFQQIQRIVWPS